MNRRVFLVAVGACLVGAASVSGRVFAQSRGKTVRRPSKTPYPPTIMMKPRPSIEMNQKPREPIRRKELPTPQVPNVADSIWKTEPNIGPDLKSQFELPDASKSGEPQPVCQTPVSRCEFAEGERPVLGEPCICTGPGMIDISGNVAPGGLSQ